MVEIPIEKKGGFLPWWAWLALAVILIALAVWIFDGDDRGERVAEAPVATGAPTAPVAADARSAAADGPITSLDSLVGAPTDTVVGREVRLSNVPAGVVAADAGFWITGASGREYVILHEVRTPDTPVEGRIDVKQGDRLDIVGKVRAAAEGVPQDAAIPGPTAPLPSEVAHYIDARSVTRTR